MGYDVFTYKWVINELKYNTRLSCLAVYNVLLLSLMIKKFKNGSQIFLHIISKFGVPEN